MGELECSSVSKGGQRKSLWVSAHIWSLYNPPQIKITLRGTRKHNVTIGLRLFPFPLCVSASANASDARLNRHNGVAAFQAHTHSLHTNMRTSNRLYILIQRGSSAEDTHTRSLLDDALAKPSPTCNFATTFPQPCTTLPKITLQ